MSKQEELVAHQLIYQVFLSHKGENQVEKNEFKKQFKKDWQKSLLWK